MAEFNQQKAIEDWTELHRRVSVGAYEERKSEHFETGTYPDDGVEESIDNLTELAARHGLEFIWRNNAWSLEPMSEETRAAREQAEREPPDLVAEQMHRIESPGYNELGEDEPLYHFPEEEDDEEYIGEVGDEEGDGSGLHQCAYCYNLVSEGHEEFCRLNPNRNRNIVP